MRLTNTGEFDVEDGLDQHFDVLRELGECHTALGNWDRARECYRRAADLSPDRAAPHVGLGILGIQSDRLEEAEAAFRRAVALDPGGAEAYGGLAVVFQRREDYQAALDMYLRCLERDADNLVALLNGLGLATQIAELTVS